MCKDKIFLENNAPAHASRGAKMRALKVSRYDLRQTWKRMVITAPPGDYFHYPGTTTGLVSAFAKTEFNYQVFPARQVLTFDKPLSLPSTLARVETRSVYRDFRLGVRTHKTGFLGVAE